MGAVSTSINGRTRTVAAMPPPAPWAGEALPDEPSDRDLRRALRLFRYDPKFAHENYYVPIKLFAAYVGLSRQTCYQFMNRNMTVKPASRARLEAGIRLVFAGDLYWRRLGRHHWSMFLCR